MSQKFCHFKLSAFTLKWQKFWDTWQLFIVQSAGTRGICKVKPWCQQWPDGWLTSCPMSRCPVYRSWWWGRPGRGARGRSWPRTAPGPRWPGRTPGRSLRGSRGPWGARIEAGSGMWPTLADPCSDSRAQCSSSRGQWPLVCPHLRPGAAPTCLRDKTRPGLWAWPRPACGSMSGLQSWVPSHICEWQRPGPGSQGRKICQRQNV